MKDEHQKQNRSWLMRLLALVAREPQNREQLMEMLRNAETRDVLSAEMLGMMERILHVAEMQVREVMIPKAQMIVLHKDDHFEKILRIVKESGHSRFPVMDRAGKDVIGIVLAKDLLKYCFDHEPGFFKLPDILRPAVFTPQSKRLDILLREFRVNRNHIAIVIDEYGHVAGLVTIEDVLEQIVGDIEDEYDVDEEEGQIKKISEGVYIVKSSTLIDEFNTYFHSDFNDDEFDTIGGIVLQGFGYLPKRGESIKIKHFRFKVLHSDNRRIYLLEVKLVKTKAASNK